jgi:excisionase family DNA binding protein
VGATLSEPKLIGANQAARLLGVSVWTVRRMARSGTLQPVRLGPRANLRFRRSDVDALIDDFRGDSR